MSEHYIERYWRDATPADAIKEPPMVARFRDYTQVEWSARFPLDGWARKGAKAWRGGGAGWAYCQVYDVPDPGEGWRLIDIEHEEPQEGDEWCDDNGAWKKRHCGGVSSFCNRDIYRRRITPAVTYVPFTWEDREQLRGKEVLAKEPHRQVEFTCGVFQLNDDGTFFINEFYSVWLCKNAVFVDTGEPVGKKVTQ